ncbi:hypothetical protein BC829DRAFT_16644 [Chytridium lagenaria]|nr:hypothetical protein BC829DRAFT_16644 [Chytridium lagenaria]
MYVAVDFSKRQRLTTTPLTASPLSSPCMRVRDDKEDEEIRESSIHDVKPFPWWWWWWSVEDERGVTALHRAVSLEYPDEIIQPIIDTILTTQTPISPTPLNTKFHLHPPLLMRTREGYTHSSSLFSAARPSASLKHSSNILATQRPRLRRMLGLL